MDVSSGLFRTVSSHTYPLLLKGEASYKTYFVRSNHLWCSASQEPTSLEVTALTISAKNVLLGKFHQEKELLRASPVSKVWYIYLFSSSVCRLFVFDRFKAIRSFARNCAFAGFFMNRAGQRECFPCEAGTYADIVGLPRCRLAPRGSFVEREGQSEARVCPAGDQVAAWMS